jgi:hypothetical protein
MQTESQPGCVQVSPDGMLRLRVSPTDAGHHLRPRRRIYDINHASAQGCAAGACSRVASVRPWSLTRLVASGRIARTTMGTVSRFCSVRDNGILSKTSCQYQ